MSIEFHCPVCDTLLRIPNDAAGKKILCPNCNNVTDNSVTGPEPLESPFATEKKIVSDGGSFETSAGPWNYADYVESDNPFQPPDDLGKEDAVSQLILGDMEPRKLRFGEVTALARKVFFRNFFAYFLLGVLSLFTVFPVITIAIVEEYYYDLPGGLLGYIDYLVPIVYLFTSLVGLLFVAGMIACSLDAAQKGKTTFFIFVKGMKRFFGFLSYSIVLCVMLYVPLFIFMIGSYILMFVGVGVFGSFLGVILMYFAILGGGVFWHLFIMFRFGWGYFAMIDRKASVAKAIDISLTISRGNVRVAILLFLVHGLLSAIFCVITFGLGLLLAIPYNFCLMAVCYLVMAGRPDAQLSPRKITLEW